MNRIKKILACIDLSPYSLNTLKYAIEFAKDTGAKVVVFNVINQHEISSIEAYNLHYPSFVAEKIPTKEYIDEMRKVRLEKIEALLNEHFADHRSLIEVKIEIGVPFEAILDAIETEKADLVVMATQGRGNLSRVFFGSVAEKVFRHSPVPVVSVRDNQKSH